MTSDWIFIEENKENFRQFSLRIVRTKLALKFAWSKINNASDLLVVIN